MNPSELGDGVVAVLDEDALVELLGPRHPDLDGGRPRRGAALGELVEEEAAQLGERE